MVFWVFVESGKQRLDCACAVGLGFGPLVFTLCGSTGALSFFNVFSFLDLLSFTYAFINDLGCLANFGGQGGFSHRNLLTKGWSESNIHELEDLGNSVGQNPGASYNHEANRMAARRTSRFEVGAEQLAWRRGEEHWWSTNSGTHATTDWNEWHRVANTKG